MVAVSTLVLAAALGTADPARAATGDITTFAGGRGEGVATNIAQQPAAVAVRGPLIYTAEHLTLVRVLDLRTGLTRVIAGDGRLGFGGDGGPATSASLDHPRGVAVDDAGSVYIADGGNDRIRRVTPDGIITTFAGGGASLGDDIPATSAQLRPWGMDFDAAGNLYVAEPTRIRRIDPSGRITTVAGTGTYGFSGDGGPATSAQMGPTDVAVDEAGNLFIADRGNDRIRKVTTAGTITTVAGNGEFLPIGDGGPATEAGLAYPETVAVRDGSIYVNGMNNRSVRRVDPGGIITTVAGDGEYGDDGDGGPALAASLQAYDLDFDADGNLYMADWFNDRLRRMDPLGVIGTVAGNGTYTFGGDGGPALDAQIGPLTRMAFDGAGNMFVADVANDAVRRIDPSGVITTVATVDFVGVGGLAFDAAGRLHIAESGQSRVVRLEPSGALTPVAGGRYGDEGDGGPATEAAMFLPSSLAFDAAGNLYILDFYAAGWGEYGHVRRVDPAGTITTLVWPGSDNGGYLAACKGGDIHVDQAGRILVTDVGGVLRIDLAAGITRIAGKAGGFGEPPLGDGGPANDATMFCPGGVTSDSAGNVYVGDPDHHRVRRIDAAGILSTVAGGGDEFIGDGGPATEAALWLAPAFGDVVLDGAGDLYVGTAAQLVGSGGRIRRVEAPGALPGATTTSSTSTTTSTSTSTTSSTTTTTIAAPTTGKAWGLNHVGQLGNGSAANGTTPLPSAMPAGATGVAAGFYHSLSLNGDGSVSASGWNVFGQLGNGSTANAPTPVKVAGLTGVRQVSAGAFHSLALKHDGTVWAWGWNGYGQLGTGTTAQSLEPVRVNGLTGVVAVSAGGVHNLALKGDGTVWAWGWDALGQLGTAPGSDSRVPTRVANLTAVAAVAAGGYHSMAQRSDGTVWAWGWNQHGQLGTGSDAAMSAVPTKVSGLTSVRSIAGGLLHSVAATSDGSAWAWGWNGVGPLGTGTVTTSRVPLRVAALTGVDNVAAGAYHSLASKTDGTLWAWGWNHYRQLGNGSTADSHVPVPVAGVTAVRAVAGGAGHTMSVGG